MATNHPEREAVARIIDPAALWEHTGVPGFPLAEAYQERQTKALAKADAIIAALDARREPVSVGHEALIARGREFADTLDYADARNLVHDLANALEAATREGGATKPMQAQIADMIPAAPTTDPRVDGDE